MIRNPFATLWAEETQAGSPGRKIALNVAQFEEAEELKLGVDLTAGDP